MLAAAATPTSRACGQVIASMLAHTLRYDATRGTANPKTAAIRPADTPVRRIVRPRRDRALPVPRAPDRCRPRGDAASAGLTGAAGPGRRAAAASATANRGRSCRGGYGGGPAGPT